MRPAWPATFRRGPLAAGIAAWLLLCGPALLPGVQLAGRDTARLYYPVKRFFAEGLRQGELRFWAPWAEGGVSLLGQVTPGLLHPFSLLYLLLPFELAFTLNHLLALFLGGAGVYLLARRLGASEWAALAGALAFGGSGALVSAASSNLPFALGGAAVPLALAGLFWLCERPAPRRLLAASVALSLCAYAGDPQSFVIAAVVGLGWARRREAVAWVACACLLSAPVALPGLTQLARSERAQGLSGEERSAFSLPPVRLLGLAVPRAFDGTDPLPGEKTDPYAELIARRGSAPFYDSILFGLPALLFAFSSRRRGLLLAAGAFLLLAVAPGFGIFRYAEKLVLPAGMLLAIAAALGCDRALGDDRRRTAVLAVALATACAAGALVCVFLPGPLTEAIRALGRTQDGAAALRFVHALTAGLATSATLAALVFALARFGAALPALPIAAGLCAISALATSPVRIAALELYRRPSSTGELVRKLGKTRVFVDATGPLRVPGAETLLPEEARLLGGREALWPQLQALDGLEGVAPYFSAPDARYLAALREAQEAVLDVLGADAVVVSPPAEGLPRSESGYGVRSRPSLPRAFVVHEARVVADPGDAVRTLPGLRLRQEGIVAVSEGEVHGSSVPASVAFTRPASGRIEVDLTTSAPGLLVVGEHFDPGWRARLDGETVRVLEADVVALGIRVPAGRHQVTLRYVPPGLLAGGLFALGAVLGCFWLERKRR